MSNPLLMDHAQVTRKTLGTVISFVLAILGLPGLREDVSTWATWLNWVRENVYWWLLLAAAVVVLAVTWWPTVRKLRRTSTGVAARGRLAAKLMPLDCELIPIWFDVDLTLDVPQVMVTLRAVNYLDGALTLDRVAVDYFHLNRGPVLENVTDPGEVIVEPQQSREVYCRKRLLDSEIRAFSNCREEDQYEAAVRLSAKGRSGKQEFSYRPGATFRIHGKLSRLQIGERVELAPKRG